MYKKKLGVRVVTAITVGSLLCSNASVAMAAEEVSSIIKEHTADEETTEAPEEEVTETEEVVEETTEAETEEVVEETTEVEADEEELENDFEEVELETEVQKAPAVEEAAEELQDDVNNEKTVTVKFVCDGNLVDEYTFNTQYSATKVSRKDLEKELDSNYKLVDEETEWFEYGTGYEVELEIEVKAVIETVQINFYSEEEGRQIAEKSIEVEAGTTQVNASVFADLVPEGYELVTTGDVAINGGYIYAEVRKVAAQTETVKINFYSEEEGKQIAEKSIEVEAGTTQVNASVFADLVPEGYELVTTGDVAINGGYIYAEVRKVAAQTETVKINFYSEEEGKQIAEKSIEVEAGTTQVNASVFADLVPEGYELVTTGDVAINGGYIYAEVRKVAAQTETVKINFYSEEEGKQIAEKSIEVARQEPHR